MYQKSARFDLIISITWILTDTKRSKNIQNNVNFVRKIRTQHRPNKQDSQKKKCVLKKAKQPFHGFYMLKTHTCRFLTNLLFKPVVTSKFSRTSQKEKKVSIYSVQVCQVKLSQTKKFSKLAYLEQSTSCTNKTRYISMVHKRTICGKRAGFPFFIKKNIY